MSFPEKPHSSIAAFYEAYTGQVTQALASVPKSALAAAEIVLSRALEADAHVYACGNGGSAAISNHLVCDHAKGIQTDTALRPRVHSLSSTMEMLTAIANDLDYAEVFAYQLKTFGRPGDVLITISSSGDSENVVRAVQWAKDNGMATIALTGFTGGRTAKLADVNLHVSADNYGIIEDVHQSLMHVLAQFIRMNRMPRDLVGARKF
ncbi:phosphoheptose isomerase [Paramagnetospirillum kuznetsovii]|uniref:Phosphoheptose isomerase n=1 Tax=Paramagnetospirillum kuznetsovii TaxID=2053833 RepID=A0A364P2R4_9PROT|nr:SIS domain-containing protein [Paramagnetospirillum kuznetsovii]RAU23623.1 phosphoheptose isomerase [Paramagnetospirillum kuznetsovii]